MSLSDVASLLASKLGELEGLVQGNPGALEVLVYVRGVAGRLGADGCSGSLPESYYRGFEDADLAFRSESGLVPYATPLENRLYCYLASRRVAVAVSELWVNCWDNAAPEAGSRYYAPMKRTIAKAVSRLNGRLKGSGSAERVLSARSPSGGLSYCLVSVPAGYMDARCSSLLAGSLYGYLDAHRGVFCSAEALWADAFGRDAPIHKTEQQLVSAAICYLRKQLGEGENIVNRRGVGYCLL
ncbi:helix-turn-helix domain-containing protein [Candidatus Woesearchaeota archaeon]|nr:helix-turn-helix domain-containing protein [Candidatus Woesearchaeota archaeon]